MKKIKIFKDLFRFCDHLGSNQKKLESVFQCSTTRLLTPCLNEVDVNEGTLVYKLRQITLFFDYLNQDNTPKLKKFIHVNFTKVKFQPLFLNGNLKTVMFDSWNQRVLSTRLTLIHVCDRFCCCS